MRNFDPLATERRAWLAVLVYVTLLYSTLTLAYDAYILTYKAIGRSEVSWWITALLVLTGAILLVYASIAARNRPGALITFVLIVVGATYCLWNLPAPAKRFHFFQYAPLTLLVLKAVSFRSHDRYRYVWTLALVMLIGLGDETLQGLLPKRHFGFTDVMVNTLAGLLTLIFVTFVIDGSSTKREPPA